MSASIGPLCSPCCAGSSPPVGSNSRSCVGKVFGGVGADALCAVLRCCTSARRPYGMPPPGMPPPYGMPYPPYARPPFMPPPGMPPPGYRQAHGPQPLLACQ